MTASDAAARGLHYEENLLWEKERSDEPGVDLPDPEGLSLRTGVNEREEIGLPQVSEFAIIDNLCHQNTLVMYE